MMRFFVILIFSSPAECPNPGIKPRSPALQVDSLPAEPQGKPCKLYFRTSWARAVWERPVMNTVSVLA